MLTPAVRGLLKRSMQLGILRIFMKVRRKFGNISSVLMGCQRYPKTTMMATKILVALKSIKREHVAMMSRRDSMEGLTDATS